MGCQECILGCQEWILCRQDWILGCQDWILGCQEATWILVIRPVGVIRLVLGRGGEEPRGGEQQTGQDP